jgi:hypothetical protein
VIRLKLSGFVVYLIILVTGDIAGGLPVNLITPVFVRIM